MHRIIPFLLLAAILLLPGAVNCSDLPEMVILRAGSGFEDASGENLNGVVGTLEADGRTARLSTNLAGRLVIAGDGIILDGGSHTLRGNPAQKRGKTRYSGITIGASSDVVVRNISIADFFTGMTVKDSRNTRVEDAIIKTCGTGIHLTDSLDAAVVGSVISSNDYGIIIKGGSGHAVGKCAIAGNQYHGVKIFDKSRDITLRGNRILHNGHVGVMISQEAARIVIRNNNIGKNSRIGLSINTYGSKTLVFNNNFYGNGFKHAWISRRGGEDVFNRPPPVGGNYWGKGEYQVVSTSDSPRITVPWVEPDSDGDGFADNSYPVYQTYSPVRLAQDNYPWTRPSGWVPVMRELGGYEEDQAEEAK